MVRLVKTHLKRELNEGIQLLRLSIEKSGLIGLQHEGDRVRSERICSCGTISNKASIAGTHVVGLAVGVGRALLGCRTGHIDSEGTDYESDQNEKFHLCLISINIRSPPTAQHRSQ